MQAASHQLIAHVARDHHQYLRGYARHLCRESADADDLMQDALLAALRRAQPLPTVDDARAWLTTVIRRRFVDGCRRRATRRRCQAALAATTAATPEPPPPWWHALDLETVRAHLHTLPPALAAPFQMFTVERASYRAIADRLGIPVATVGTRILRARQRLRTRLGALAAAADPAGDRDDRDDRVSPPR